MILELDDILIQPGKQAEFDQAIQHGIQTYIAPSKGFIGYRINKCIETPERYVLMNYWETLENHTVDFRGSLSPNGVASSGRFSPVRPSLNTLRFSRQKMPEKRRFCCPSEANQR